MKLSRKIIAATALVSMTYLSCSNDIKILAPYKNITVVYGLLDQNDSTHYIRINKGFEGNGNAYSMAKQYDSIYYPVSAITAYIQDSNPYTGAIANTYTLDTTTTIPLGSGTFSYPKQLLYYTKAILNANDYYNLIVVNKKTGQKLRGSTSLIADANFSNNLLHAPYFPVSFDTTYPTSIIWVTTPNVRIYQMTLRFYYREALQGDTVHKSLDWIFPEETLATLTGSLTLNYNYTGQQFLNTLSHSIVAGGDYVRYADSMGIIFTSGSDDLNTYVELSQPPIGINQDVPSFSDVKNGVGLYTARHIQAINKKLGAGLIDSIATNSATSALHFQR